MLSDLIMISLKTLVVAVLAVWGIGIVGMRRYIKHHLDQ